VRVNPCRSNLLVDHQEKKFPEELKREGDCWAGKERGHASWGGAFSNRTMQGRGAERLRKGSEELGGKGGKADAHMGKARWGG